MTHLIDEARVVLRKLREAEERVAALQARASRMEVALREIAARDREWDDVDPYDGLHQDSVRDFAHRALERS